MPPGPVQFRTQALQALYSVADHHVNRKVNRESRPTAGAHKLMSALLPRRALRSDGTFRRIVASTYEGIARLNK